MRAMMLRKMIFLRTIRFVYVAISLFGFLSMNIGCKPIYIQKSDPHLGATAAEYYSYSGTYTAALSADAHSLTITFSQCLRDHEIECIMLYNSSLNVPKVLTFDTPVICTDNDPALPLRIAGSVDSIPIVTNCTATAKVVTSTICHDNITGQHLMAVMPFAVGICL